MTAGRPLVTRDNQQPAAQRSETRIQAGRTDKRQRCDTFRMRLRQARDIRQHGSREVGATDPEMIKDLH